MIAHEQVEALKRDCVRLTADNNQLHLELLSQTEQHKAFQRESYSKSRHLEDQLAEVDFVRQKTIERYLALEKENEGLKEKMKQLMKLDPGKLQICIPSIAVPVILRLWFPNLYLRPCWGVTGEAGQGNPSMSIAGAFGGYPF